MLKILAFCITFLSFNSIVKSQTASFTAEPVKNKIINIDGNIENSEWGDTFISSDFVQYEPLNGKEPTQNTEFNILYDDNYIYVAIKCYDSEPEKIEKRLSMRDSWDGDLVAIQFDSYYDKKTAFVFSVSAAGVRNDAVTINDNVDDDDDTWDPLWTVKTSITDSGWASEMKIPLSQLRFGKKENQVWGLQVARYIFRNGEWSVWQHISKETSGWVSRFGLLTGLKDLKPKKQIEIAPYISTSYNIYEPEDENPFYDGSDFSGNAGLDAKIGITNDLTLDLTINPDFGQVEADPSEVNLTAFETFFSEKRPFFIEGSNITNFNLTPGGNPWSRDNLFYSRRLGSSPHYNPDLQDDEYSISSKNTGILGAVKLTGKTKKGLSVGIIESFNNREFVEIDLKGDRRRELAEPYTNYFASRIQKDMNQGNTIIGGMITSTNRFFTEEHLDYLTKNAYTGGIDFKQYFNDKKYYVSTQIVGSRIEGSKNAINEEQISSRRYFQRPDAHFMNYDSTRTSLSGQGGNFLFAKTAVKGLSFMANVTWRSPGLELNDIGYLRRANTIFQFIWLSYKITEPFSIFRSMGFNINQWSGFDFGGTNTFFGGNFGAWTELNNFWNINFSITREGNNLDDTFLRGGPAMYLPGNKNYYLEISSNSKKKLIVSAGTWGTFFDEKSGKNSGLYGSILYKPLDFLSVEVSPYYETGNNNLQFIDIYSFNDQDNYLFAKINQNTFYFTTRINLLLTPDFSIQYYGSPFISAAIFSNYKKITKPLAENYTDRFHLFDDSEIIYLIEDEVYAISEAGNNRYDYYFDLPDFNFKQFRSNLVLRWEYKPGSLLFLVWSQDKTDSDTGGNFNFGENLKSMFQVSSNDVFLIKLSYRFVH